MFTGTIVSDGGKGFWFAEQDITHDSIFVHQKEVIRQRYLHVGDRIKFDLGPNPKRPDKIQAINVEVIGKAIAIQRSARELSTSPRICTRSQSSLRFLRTR